MLQLGASNRRIILLSAVLVACLIAYFTLQPSNSLNVNDPFRGLSAEHQHNQPLLRPAPQEVDPAEFVVPEGATALRCPPCEKPWAFVDLGGNRGDTLAAFVNKDSSVNLFQTLESLSHETGSEVMSPDPNDYCLYVVEANPQHNEALEAAGAALRAEGHTVCILTATAVTPDGTSTTLYMEPGSGVNDAQEGASIRSDKVLRDKAGSTMMTRAKWFGSKGLEWFHDKLTTVEDAARPVAVAGVSLPELLHQASNGGRVPVAVKLDVEGAEYDILSAMVEGGTLCMTRGPWAVEWHTYNVATAEAQARNVALEDAFFDAFGACPDSAVTSWV